MLGVVLHTVANKVVPPGRISAQSPHQNHSSICHDRRAGLKQKPLWVVQLRLQRRTGFPIMSGSLVGAAWRRRRGSHPSLATSLRWTSLGRGGRADEAGFTTLQLQPTFAQSQRRHRDVIPWLGNRRGEVCRSGFGVQGRMSP